MTIVNTQTLFPQGEYILSCSDVPKEENIRGTVFWRFRFDTLIAGEPTSYEELCPVWLVGPIFKALQFKEISPGSFDVQTTEAMGRKIKGSVVHEEIRSGSKKGNIVARLKNMTPIKEGLQEGDINTESDIPF